MRTEPYLQDPDVTLWQGDCLDVLRTMPDKSVHMCCTSPPFYGLRDYGADGQIGLEESPDDWVARLVEVFREVRRVLRDDGTLWVEIGDSYAGSWGNQGRKPERGTQRPIHGGMLTPVLDGRYPDPGSNTGKIPEGASYKPKDLLGQPWLLAFALRADGWYLRSEIIWARPNPMPESVTDRPTKAHSTVFLLSKSPRYFYDQEAIREDGQPRKFDNNRVKDYAGGTSAHIQPYSTGASGYGMHPNGANARSVWEVEQETLDPSLPPTSTRSKQSASWQERKDAGEPARQGLDGKRNIGSSSVAERGEGANARSVWRIPTEPTPFAHFATWPQKLCRRMILAGTSERGVCPECGAPWVRETEHGEVTSTGGSATGARAADLRSGASSSVLGQKVENAYNTGEFVARSKITTGWALPCGHEGTAPATVLDPFGGSGTTALVARKLGRRAILIELNAEYCELASSRLAQQSLFAVADD